MLLQQFIVQTRWTGIAPCGAQSSSHTAIPPHGYLLSKIKLLKIKLGLDRIELGLPWEGSPSGEIETTVLGYKTPFCVGILCWSFATNNLQY